jgi:hypothetical protein
MEARTDLDISEAKVCVIRVIPIKNYGVSDIELEETGAEAVAFPVRQMKNCA